MGKRKKEARSETVSFPQAARDVLIASMNRGQFPLALVGLVVIVALWRMPGEEVSRLVFEVWESIKNGKIVGYIAAIAATTGWFIHAKAQRRMISAEMRRVSEERNKCQAARIGATLPSSEE